MNDLTQYIRQYRHNNSNELVFAYDKSIEQEISRLKKSLNTREKIILDEGYRIDELKEQVKELEEDKKELWQVHNELHALNKRYREALEWYGDEDNWDKTVNRTEPEYLRDVIAVRDKGKRAREALDGEKG